MTPTAPRSDPSVRHEASAAEAARHHLAADDAGTDDAALDPAADGQAGIALGDTGGDQGGEGNHDAARRHRDSVERFVADGRVDEAAREAAPDSPEQARDLQEAERRGRAPARD